MGEEREHLQSSDSSDVPKRKSKKLKRCLCIFATIFFVLLLAAAIAILVVLLIIVGQQPARVVTTCGSVEGNYDPVNKVFSFKGIPFAAPPVRERRFRAPEPLSNKTCWQGVHKADQFKSMCAQYTPEQGLEGAEDCLYLNVFTPMVDPSTPLPVMVYIHGGYLQWGNSHIPGYSPDERATSQLQVVFVSIQYRLNAFGFLVLEALPGHGNYGFLDQVEALRWVQNNIAGFGGDPKKVTIFGQSSGGTSVWALMMSPMAKNLFSRAWMLSGSPVYNQTTKQARAANSWIADSLAQKCEYLRANFTEKCLIEQLTTADILNAIYPASVETPSPTWDILKDSMDLPILDYFEPALAVVDGEFMPEEPFVMWDEDRWRGNYSDVPVIIGSTAQELDLDPAPGRNLKLWHKAELDTYVGARLNPFGGNITNETLALYPYSGNAVLAFTNMSTDVRITCATDLMAKKAARALNSSVYRYIVTSRPSRTVYPMGLTFGSDYSFHMWDMYAFYSAFDVIMDRGASQSDNDFRDTLQAEVMNFVKGDKGAPKDSHWAAYPNITALISDKITYTSAYHEERCKFWLGKGFFGYAWIN